MLDDEILEQNNIGWDMNAEREVEELMVQNGGHLKTCASPSTGVSLTTTSRKRPCPTAMSPARGIGVVIGGNSGSMSIG